MPCIEAQLTDISRDSLTVELNNGEKFVLPFERYGYFRFCTIAELAHVTCDGFALEWPEAMIDLELELLRYPEKEGTLTPVDKWLAFREELRQKKAIRANALRAAHTKSLRKAASSRINGKKGGRPKKKPVEAPV